MEYRRLGASGLKISEISLGSWLTYGTTVEMEQARACVLKAYELGVNHFDCAIAYGNRPHEAEEILGKILRELPRTSYTVTSKAFWKFGPSTYDQGLSRKTLMERVDMSLKATGLDYIDIFYCHRYDTETDLEETLRALDDLVAAGKILYYGFSEWTAAQIENMMAIVDKRNLRRPVVDQPGYNMLWRTPEQEVMPVCAKHGMGVVAFSPLAQGILTGKYKSTTAMPAGTRGADPSKGRWIKEDLTEDAVAKVQKLTAVAAKLDLTVGQLALAWVLRRPEMTSALVGATRPEQVEENVKAAGVKLPAEIVAEIETILA
jgi:aryl-alcohol dehydrogenase-like predicted oxidoreductase